MRNLVNIEEPEILATNKVNWQAEYEADPTSDTKKYRYRKRPIKTQAKAETSSKCAYCESKIGHNTPGDIEHKVPTSVDITRHFDWTNLTIACTECNRRKNDYFSTVKPFLDPYNEDVESQIVHHGPIVSWAPNTPHAEISIKTLELHNRKRVDLILRKIEKIGELDERLERHAKETDLILKEIVWKEIEEMGNAENEYSGMINQVLVTYASAASA